MDITKEDFEQYTREDLIQMVLYYMRVMRDQAIKESK